MEHFRKNENNLYPSHKINDIENAVLTTGSELPVNCNRTFYMNIAEDYYF